MRARMALAYAGQKCEIREVDLKNKPDALLEVSPKGTVPVLVLPDGKVIDESFDIMQWAIAQHDPDEWHKGDDHALIGPPLKPLLDAMRVLKYDPENAGFSSAQNSVITWMTVMNVLLEKDRFLTGEKCALVDVSLYPIIRQLSKIDPEWFKSLEVVNVYRWLDEINAMPFFAQAMEKYPAWQPGDAATYFPPKA
jgi:glutathione S-transferase